MKKKLVGYLILACSIFGLTLVGSCKDYEIETLQEEIDNLKGDVYNGTLKDTLKDIYVNLGDLKKKANDTLKARIDTLYKFLGDAINDTLQVDSDGTVLTGISSIINYLNRGMSDAAAAAAAADSSADSIANELKQLRYGWSDSLKEAYDTASLAYALANLNKKDLDKLNEKAKDVSDSLKTLYSSLNDSLTNHLARIKALEARPISGSGIDNKDSIKKALDSIKIVYALAQQDSIKILDLIQKDKDLNKRIDSLAKVANNLRDTSKIYLDSAIAYADEIAAKVKIQIHDSLNVVRAEYKAADQLIKARLAGMSDSINNNKVRIDSLCKQVDTLKLRFDTIWDTLSAIVKRLDNVENRLDIVEERVDSLMDAEKHRITSLYIQGAETPAFGMFALPVGVRSNILLAYAGEVKNAPTGVHFPTFGDSRMAFKNLKFNDEDKAMLAASGFNLDVDGDNLSGTLFDDSIGNAGKLYFTVNPNEVDITADPSYYSFTIRNSQGKAASVKLDNITKSSKTLKFGVNTRAAGDPATGFYEASVSIAEADIAKFKPNFDKSALVSIAKDLKNTRDLNLLSVSSSILKSFDDVFDANALNVEWKDSLGNHSVTSGYDLAIATITPLSYHTLPAAMDQFELTKKRLPLNPIDELLAYIKAPKVQFNINKMHMGTINVEIKPFEYVPSIGLSPIDVTIPVYDGGTLLGTGKTTIDLTAQNNEIEAAIGKMLDSLKISFAGIEDSVKTLVNRIQDSVYIQVNDMIEGVDKQLEEAITGVFDDLKNQIGSNKFISRVNSLTSKINKVLDSANELLEVSLLYSKNGGFHPMSGTRAIPSVISGASEIELYPTSLTADILAPAYKRFVAVTNVIDSKTGKSAKKNGGVYLTALTNANKNSDNMCKVIEPNASVTFKPQGDYIYEIAYSAVDFSGYISTRKFYIRTK